MHTVIHWFRRDLRLTDNTALSAAAKAAKYVVPVYVLSDWRESHRWAGPHRQEFLCGCLESLSKDLEKIGSRLIIRQGKASQELQQLAAETHAEGIFFNRDPDPFGRKCEEQLEKFVKQMGISLRGFKDICLHERDEILTNSGTPYRVFTPYSKAWIKQAKIAPSGALERLATPASLASLKLPSLATWKLKSEGGIVAPGERAARKRMKSFLSKGISDYGNSRDNLSVTGTSRLSQDLRHGLISIRELHDKCNRLAQSLDPDGRASAQKYIGELIWREFYMQILWHFPNVLDEDFNPKYRTLEWSRRGADRWRNGETGFPIVDAAMRELAHTGFMHNRARMITAMFLTKDLQVHWRIGEQYFMQKLTDGEIASNNGGWQWCAGTGADAAPYFRIQNPWTQSARHDPNGDYIKRWLPELKEVSSEKLHRPPDSSLAGNYPLPMVNHSEAREKTLGMFQAARLR